MKYLPTLLVLLTATPAVAFDGGGLNADDRRHHAITSKKQKGALPAYSDYHASCFETQMTMWGDAAELMGDLATAHCYCEYAELEQLDTVTRDNKEAAFITCARKSTSRQEEAFIQWALPRHQQRMKQN